MFLWSDTLSYMNWVTLIVSMSAKYLVLVWILIQGISLIVIQKENEIAWNKSVFNSSFWVLNGGYAWTFWYLDWFRFPVTSSWIEVIWFLRLISGAYKKCATGENIAFQSPSHLQLYKENEKWLGLHSAHFGNETHCRNYFKQRKVLFFQINSTLHPYYMFSL